jgi:two-component system OmpR family sensor kinase
MIAGQAARLAQMTEDLLLATQLDSREFTVEREAVDIAAVARAAVDAIRVQLPAEFVVELELDAPDAVALGAPDRIQQVLGNLLDNAARYAGSPVTLRVEADDGVVRIAVADSGPGLTPVEQRRVFERFYRAGPELTRSSGGTGLGLYISHELVSRMGGRLDVRSAPGEGATFTVELPRATSGSD